MQICYVFLVSKREGEFDLGQCITWGLAKRIQPCNNYFRQSLRRNAFVNPKSPLRGAILFASPKVVHTFTNLDPTRLCMLVSEAYSRFVWKHKMLALGVCFPQHCSSAGFMRFYKKRTWWNALYTGFHWEFHWESAFVWEMPNLFLWCTTVVCYSVLHCVAMCSSALQCVAVSWNITIQFRR